MRWALLAYPFNVLGCQRITALVNSDNFHSRDFIQKVGFLYETKMEGAAPNACDILVHKMTREQFQDRYPKPASLPNIIKAS